VAENAEQSGEWIEKSIYNPFLQGNDRVVRNSDAFGTHLGTAFRDVAQPDAELLPQVFDPVACIEGVHFQRCYIDQESRPDELFVHMVVP
jgi:hypothetical protein